MPALTASALLLVTGCSSGPGPSSGSGAAPAGRAEASAAAAQDADRPLAVAAAPAATPTALARPDQTGGRAHRSTLKVSSYDRHTRRAVISRVVKATPPPSGSSTAPGVSTGPASPTATPSGTPSRSAEPGRIAVGDVIASAPAPGAPDGLLAKVTEVIGETGDGTEVQTAPTTLDTLLGGDKAKGTVPVDPSSFDVERLLPDVKVSWTKTGNVHAGPEGAKVPLGSLRVDLRADVPTPAGAPVSADASVAGYVQVAPEVDFSYGGGGSGSANGQAGPASAHLGVSGNWSSQWSLKGRAGVFAKPVRVPFAKLHADPVLQVGPIPVVVNLDLTCYFQISGDGSVTVAVEQDLKGDFKAGGTFAPGKGWTPVNESTMTSTPVRTSLTAAGNVKAALGAQATVGLYGAVGVTADLAPYLRGEASIAASAAAGPGARPTATAAGSWALYGGVDLTGALQLQLSVFGTPVFQHTIPLGALHREWRLAGGSV
ncbi:hypothetical protein [Streptomyces glomeratus]|uniref:hypothetical protein n=2 Tax=Streptomyces glomeratus TaxID=284452 RepID=UPI001F32F024|nr:hypothetical protein [Streptomyces glomeratus]MCF1509151.1 hypothetical protein [Streptomyces glomeratus]